MKVPAEYVEAVYAADLESDLMELVDLVDHLSHQMPVSSLLGWVASIYRAKRDGSLLGSRFDEIGRAIEQLGADLYTKYGV